MIPEAIEYGLPFAAAAVLLVGEGLFLLAIFFGGLAIRAIWSKITHAHR